MDDDNERLCTKCNEKIRTLEGDAYSKIKYSKPCPHLIFNTQQQIDSILHEFYSYLCISRQDQDKERATFFTNANTYATI